MSHVKTQATSQQSRVLGVYAHHNPERWEIRCEVDGVQKSHYRVSKVAADNLAAQLTEQWGHGTETRYRPVDPDGWMGELRSAFRAAVLAENYNGAARLAEVSLKYFPHTSKKVEEDLGDLRQLSKDELDEKIAEEMRKRGWEVKIPTRPNTH